jgi:hypothetical protein
MGLKALAAAALRCPTVSNEAGTGSDSRGTGRRGELRAIAAQVQTKPPVRSKEARQRAGSWSLEEWRGHFDERAGIAEFDGERSRAQAEVCAFKSCISEWLFQNPPEPHSRGSCALCDQAMTTRSATPYLARDGHVWMHADCHPDWMKRRREAAITELTALGLKLGL